MLTNIQYTATGGTTFSIAISYNADNTVKEINMGAGGFVLENTYTAGQLTNVKAYESGNLLVTGDYTYAGNQITINQLVYSPSSSVKRMIRMLGGRRTKAIVASKKIFRQLLSTPAGTTIYSQIILKNGNPVSFNAYYPTAAGGYARQFWIVFTGDSQYDAYLQDQTAGATLYSTAIYGLFDGTPSIFPDHTILLSMFIMPNFFMLTEKYFPEVLSINQHNYTTWNLKSGGCMGNVTQTFTNTAVANQLTKRTLITGTNSPVTQITYTY